MEKILTSSKTWIALGLFIYITLFFLVYTNLAASDLGRHIKNGEIILQSGKVFHTNLYSYTNPDFPAPNHHWLFGVISYLVYQASGFAGLTVMGAILYTSAIGLVFYYSWRNSSFYPAVIATILTIPLFAHRSETRPEAFSLFFFALFFCGFGWLLQQKNFKYTWQFAVGAALLLALWVNIHIFFVLTAVLGIAATIHVVVNKKYQFTKPLAAIAAGLVAGAFVNPLGLQLVLYPLQIFGNYGYRVAENQSLWFFLHEYTQSIHWYLAFFIVTFLVLTMWYVKKNIRPYIYNLIVSVFFLLFTTKLIRMENIFAITAIPLLSYSFTELWNKYGPSLVKNFKNTSFTMVLSFLGFGLVCIAFGTGLFFPFKSELGLGLYPGYDRSLAFVQKLPDTGPIFNNFDVGSMLVFALHPQRKVYIDNRAEAYPAEFIQNEYQKQNDEETWKQLEEKYHFSTIIFYRQEATNWGQEFMVNRIQDKSWVPIYVDNYLIVFVKDIPANQSLIEQYRLPPSMFSITKP